MPVLLQWQIVDLALHLNVKCLLLFCLLCCVIALQIILSRDRINKMLKPLRPQKSGLIKNKSQYELYEDDLQNYKSKSKSNIQQWNLLTSHILSNSPQKNGKSPTSKPLNLPHIQQQQSHKNMLSHRGQSNTPDIMSASSKIKEDKGDKGMKSSRLHNRGNYGRTSEDEEDGGDEGFGDKVKRQFESKQCEQKSTQQLLTDIRNMRQMLQSLNSLVTQKLSKYQLSSFSPKGMAVQTPPQKQPQILQKRLQLNTSILQSLQKQKQQLISRDKELQQKDYLIELQELVNQAINDIKIRKKDKHQKNVIVGKMDNKLIEIKELEDDDEYRMVKILKHNILFYFKKFHQNRNKLETLQTKIKQLGDKDKDIGKVLGKATKVAEQKNLVVKANPIYVSNKKYSDQLSQKVQILKKKLQVTKKSKQIQTQKLQKEIQSYKKQYQYHEQRIQQLSNNVSQFTKNTNQTIEKYQVSNKMLNKISYKFAEALLKDSNSNTGYTGSSLIQQPQPPKNHILLRPKNKYSLNKSITSSAENSALPSGRYTTLQTQSPRELQKNDKNIETLDFAENKSKQFRIKPSLNINLKKRAGDNRSRLVDASLDAKDQVLENGDTEINYKPKRFQKIIANRKDIGV